MTDKTKNLTTADKKALAELDDLLVQSGAGWATEAQWRAWADRVTLKVDPDRPGLPNGRSFVPVDTQRRARGFRPVDLVEAGAVEQSSAVFHAMQPGAAKPAAPLTLYRPAVA